MTTRRIALRGVFPPNAPTNQGTAPSDRRSRRAAPAVIRKRTRNFPAERQAIHRGVLVVIVRHYPADSKSGGVSIRISPCVKKKVARQLLVAKKLRCISRRHVRLKCT